MKLLLKISFLGTNYNGYQVQPNKPTVQQSLNEAAKRIFGFDCDIVGCSRTDSGVHANEFFACVSKKGENSLECTIPMESVPLAFNSVLPDDIAVIFAKTVESDFHPRYDVKQKEYIYKIWNSTIKDPFGSDRAYHIPKKYTDEAVYKMDLAAKHFCGRHDFSAFMAQGSKIVDAHREDFYTTWFALWQELCFWSPKESLTPRILILSSRAVTEKMQAQLCLRADYILTRWNTDSNKTDKRGLL